MTQRQTDHSVLTALSELRGLEDQRVDEEHAATERQRQAKAAAEAARHEAELHAERVAEAEARLRVEDEARVRDNDADRRLAALRAELNAVQAERERLHGTLLASAHEPVGVHDSSARPWVWAFAASAVVATGLAIGLAYSSGSPAPVYVLAPPATTAPVSAPAVMAPEPPATPPTVADAIPTDGAPRVRPPRAGLTKVHHDRNNVAHPIGDGLDPVDCNEDDPTCGMLPSGSRAH